MVPAFAALLNNRVTQDVDMVTLRINYRFGGYGAPIAARYSYNASPVDSKPRHSSGAS